MPDHDSLQRFAFEAFPVRGQLVHLNRAWQAVLERHDYPETVRPVLGQALAATVLLTGTLKFAGRMTLQLQGDGPLNLVVVQSTDELAVRGLARWHGEVPRGALAAQTGNGRLVITIQADTRARPYQGIVPLSGATLAECLGGYFDASEQLPTRIWLSAGSEAAAGLLLQRMPGEVTPEQHDDDWRRVQLLAATLRAEELLQAGHRETLQRIFPEDDLRLFAGRPVNFHCTCSAGRVEDVLRSLGAAELHTLLDERGSIDVDCEFCNRKRRFDKVDVGRILSGPSAPDEPTSLH